MTDIALTIPQREFVLSNAPRPAIIGGLGSGKSRAGTMRLIYKMGLDAGCSGAYYMPIYDLLKLRAIPGVEEDLTLMGIPYKLNKSDYRISVEGMGDIIFRSFDNPSRIIAYEVAHSICDELDTLPIEKSLEVWRKVNERNREKITGINSIGMVTSPDQGFNGIAYKKWKEEVQEGYVLIKAPTYSNPFLPDDYISEIRKNYDEKLAEMYIEGEFVNLSENKVYHYFDRERHHTDRELTDNDRVIQVSIDFNVGGCCATVNVIDSNQPVAVDEFVCNDTDDFVNELKDRFSDKTVLVYPDASGSSRSTNASQSDLQIIKGAGYMVKVNPANPRIKDRINSVNRLLSHNRVKINTNKCRRLTHALEVQGYTKKGEPEKFDSHPAIDDWSDSWGYFITKEFPIRKPTISAVTVQGF